MGKVWGWGRNDSYGQLAKPLDYTGRTVAEEIQGIGIAKALGVGQQNSLAIMQDGTVWGWGKGFTGSLAHGKFEEKVPTPVQAKFPATGVGLDKFSLNIDAGTTGSITAKVLPYDTIAQGVNWSVVSESKDGVVTVSPEGEISALIEGTAVIRATSTAYPQLYADCNINVIIPSADEVVLDREIAQIGLGAIVKLMANILPAGAQQNVIWLSDNTDVATIDEEGNITALQIGTAEIRAVCAENQDLFASCTVEVVQAVTNISLDKESIQFAKVGDTEQLTALVEPDNTYTGVMWSSSDDQVASVDENGLVTAISAGIVIITATSKADPSFTAVCEVTVNIEITGVILNNPFVFIKAGRTGQLSASVLPESAGQSVKWSSSNPGIATVDENSGLVYAIAPGVTKIRVTSAVYPENYVEHSIYVYLEGQTVTSAEVVFDGETGQAVISGSISSGYGNQVTVTVKAPDQSVCFINQTSSGMKGVYQFSFMLNNPMEGTYLVYVGGTGVNGQRCISFDIGESTIILPELNLDQTDVTVYSPSFTVSGSVLKPCTITVNGQIAAENAIVFNKVITLSEGINVITVVAEDASGNMNEITITVTYVIQSTDNTPPSQTPVQNVGQAVKNKLNDIKAEGADVGAAIKEALPTILAELGKANDKEAADIIDAVRAALEDVAKKAANMQDVDAKGKLISEALQLVKKIVAVSGKVNDEASAIAITEDACSMMQSIAGLVDSKNTEGAKKAADEMKTAVKLLKTLIENVSTVNKADELSEKLLNAVAAIAKKTKGAALETKKLVDETIKVLEEILEKTGGSQIGTENIDGIETGTVSDAMVSDILSKADEAAQKANILNKKMSEYGIKAITEKKVLISVNTESGSNALNVSLPANLLSGAQEKEIDKLEIASPLATIKVEPDFLASEGEVKSVLLNIQKLEANEALTRTMSEQQRQLIGSGTVVYDFNLTVDKPNGESVKVSSFDSEVTVFVPYTLKNGEDPEKVTILYLADNGEIKNMIGVYEPETGLVRFTAKHFSKYAVKSININFKDVAGNHWAKGFIEVMAAKGIINGVSSAEYRFAPESNVTRAEFVKMIVVAKGLLDEDAAHIYSDSGQGKWYGLYVASAYKAGIITDSDDGKFRPADKITREEMAVMLSRALNQTKPEDPAAFLNFVDVNKISDNSKNDLALLVQTGIMNGKPNRLFDPQGFATRSEAAKTIYLLFNY